MKNAAVTKRDPSIGMEGDETIFKIFNKVEVLTFAQFILRVVNTRVRAYLVCYLGDIMEANMCVCI